MHFSMLTLILCVVVATGWATVGWYGRRAARRRGRRRAEWARVAAELRDLDEELDRAWEAELERIWRYR